MSQCDAATYISLSAALLFISFLAIFCICPVTRNRLRLLPGNVLYTFVTCAFYCVVRYHFISVCSDMTARPGIALNFTSLTLGAHAQWRLRYLVRVSVCLCLSVCLHSFSNYIQTTRQLMSDMNDYIKHNKGSKNNVADFATFKSYSVKTQVNKPIC